MPATIRDYKVTTVDPAAASDEVVKPTEIEIRQALAPVVQALKLSLPNVDSDEILEGLIRFEDFEQNIKEQDRLRQQKINNAAAMLIILMSST